MFRVLIIFLFFIGSIKYISAEIVDQIIIKGNKRVSKETILVYGKIKKKQDYSNSDINNILKNLYSTNFFEDVEINLSNNILTINLKEYPIVNQLIILGEKSNNKKDQIRKILNLKEKKSFIKSYLSKDVDLIKSLYSSAGFNFAKIEVSQKVIDEDKIDLVFEIDRGEKTKIDSINFIGNNKVSSRRLRDVIASEEGKFWKVLSRNTVLSQNLINLDRRLLANYYKAQGFYDIKIKSNFAEINQEGIVNLTYSIDEGKRYIINKISTNVAQTIDKKIFLPLNDIYNKYIGEYYSPFKIKKLLDEIDVIIDDNNLQFVEHNVQEIIDSEDNINVIFNIYEGEKVLVERINVIGNNVTDENVIRGELLLDEGDPYSKLSLDKSISELKDRRIFKTVKYDLKSGSKNNLKVIDILVEEQPTGEISAGAGVGTNGGTFAFNIKENNWAGTGKTLGFDIEIDQESLAGTFSYVDPNYNFLGNSLAYSLSSESNDKPDQGYENSIVSAGIRTSFEQFKDVRASLGLNASYDDLRTQGNASDALKKQDGTFNDLTASYGFSFDKRDRAFMPTSGSIINFSQSLPVYSDKPAISNLFKSSFYKTLSENLVGASKFYLSSINGLSDEDVRLSSRKGLSTKRLRGFKKGKIGPIDGNDHVGGNYAASLNLESNLPNLLPDSSNVDVSLFLDFGNVWGVDYDDTIDESNKIRSSTGIVAGWMSPLGPLSFVFSQNISKASTDETESFNFNLGTTF